MRNSAWKQDEQISMAEKWRSLALLRCEFEQA
jgi:hypothetical protein